MEFAQKATKDAKRWGTNSEGQVKYCRCTFFGHATPDRAGARPYRVQGRVARLAWVIDGLPDLLQSIDKFQVPLSHPSSSAAETRPVVAVSLLTFHPLSRLFAGPIP